jgi:hypothetical protein
MILSTAIALATFSMGGWIVGNGNRTRIAQIDVGAPTVLNVSVPLGVNLARVVDRIDPAGHTATAVESFDNGTVVLVGVEPRRFARIAHWSAGDVSHPGDVLADLHPPAPDAIVFNGDRVRLRLRDVALHPSPALAIADVAAAGSSAPTPVELGPLTSGANRTLTGDLAGCPCILNDLQISPPGGRKGQLAGHVTIDGVDVHTAKGWQPVAGIGAGGHWADTVDQHVSVRTIGTGVEWKFFGVATAPPTLRVIDRPDPLPAVVSRPLDQPDTSIGVSGLDATPIAVNAVAAVPGVPGAASNGVVVDLDYAQRAATNDTAPATAQVWVRGDAQRVRRALVVAGIPVVSQISSRETADELGRQGPGLASVLFLADAAAAAVLAALAAVLSLSAAARRRRYEYAALAAAGASRRTLFAALAIEQVVVIGFGAVTGVGAGLLATGLAGRSVPEFVHAPASPLLNYLPSPWLMGPVLIGGLVVLVAVATAAAAALLRSVTPDQLREAPV